MNFPVKAVIFDMDGVLIDSEPLWRTAMIKGFGEYGLIFTEDDCRKTTGRRFDEVVKYWMEHYKITTINAKELETRVIDLLLELIKAEGRAMEGILDLVELCISKKLKTGLATSSANVLMNAVLSKLDLHAKFHAKVSAEYLPYGKPHPEVFLHCAGQLGIAPQNCLVIEDSVNGVIAAKAAQMTVIAVPDNAHKHQRELALADYVCMDMLAAKHTTNLII